MPTTASLRNALAQFTGSNELHKWSRLFSRDVLTDGAFYLAENAGAFWLMDAIASHQTSRHLRSENFQTWTLAQNSHNWHLTCTDGNGVAILRQVISYSDFPLETVKLFAARNELGGITVMLPSEY